MQQWRPENAAMTFDEVSMERSKSFIKALQELKNLRPQLYSAADYCEKSYLHNEQKQMVLDNLKDYAVRALVNAVDHLGTVAYKLTDLFEQQTMDISSVELKISCLNQRVLTCQTYVDKEGLRQQQISVTAPRHHKHYILPNSVNQKGARNQLSQAQAKPRPHSTGTPASKTLSWHLASEANPATGEASNATKSSGNSRDFKLTPEFHLLGPKETASSLSSTHLRSSSGASGLQPFMMKDPFEVPKPLAAFKSFENPRRDLIKAPVRSRSMMSLFFAKSKASKPRRTYAH
ncbi:protein ABIL1 isoform X1 [Asparagus officinalis]|uniref:protein ABIL1 isoform X1 n=1 Tax=Asparagus officinalis TaxID=4686 RepID=UPI00098DF99D|nr:protein ABIL1 isoform X1 [Asparagus officinalis]